MIPWSKIFRGASFWLTIHSTAGVHRVNNLCYSYWNKDAISNLSGPFGFLVSKAASR
ncbi:unnamed protein product [Amoebophrya sp. A25]|nr:unnamed protein product [Amoebophrya sp. A25]|eukprot:GSA25T00020330001.1